MKKAIFALFLMAVIVIGAIHIIPVDLYALEGVKFCTSGPQCHPGMTSCGPDGWNCYCHWFMGDCVKDVPGG